MGSDNVKARRGRKLPVGRLLILLAGLLLLFWNTSDPEPAPKTKGPPRARKLIADRKATRDAEAVPVSRGEEAVEAVAEAGEQEVPVHSAVVAKPIVNTARRFYRFSAVDIDGDKQQLVQFGGKARWQAGSRRRASRAPRQVSLVVNVASQCGYTAANYKGLVSLYEDKKDEGFTVLAFPCNEFGEQEPGTDAEIKAFAAEQGATFPLFGKVNVNGPSAAPLYEWLKLQPGFEGDLAWNFVKFLISRNGKVLKRYESAWDDAQIRADVEEALKEEIDFTR